MGRVVRGLVTPAVAVLVGIVLYGHRPGPPASSVLPAVQRLTLVQKDRRWNVVPLSRGGAAGSVWYRTRGPAFSFQLRAAGLVPGARYVVELVVDSTKHAIACRMADRNGELALDTTLARFADAGCNGPARATPAAIRGPHVIELELRRDRTPPSTVASRPSRPIPPGEDHDGTPVLHSDGAARFVGTDG